MDARRYLKEQLSHYAKIQDVSININMNFTKLLFIKSKVLFTFYINKLMFSNSVLSIDFVWG